MLVSARVLPILTHTKTMRVLAMNVETITPDVWHWGKVVTCGLFAWVIGSLSACGMTGGVINSSPDGYFEMRGDAEGLRAFSDYSQGMITNGKASPDVDTAHYQLRKEQNRAKVVRFSSKNGGK